VGGRQGGGGKSERGGRRNGRCKKDQVESDKVTGKVKKKTLGQSPKRRWKESKGGNNEKTPKRDKKIRVGGAKRD